jgi:hypothetical protein
VIGRGTVVRLYPWQMRGFQHATDQSNSGR